MCVWGGGGGGGRGKGGGGEGAKVSCILCHRGVQMRLAYNWARPAILVAGNGRRGMFLFLLSSLSFLLLFLHFRSLSSLLSSISFLPFSERRHKMTHKD